VFYANFPDWGTLKTKMCCLLKKKKARARQTAPKNKGAPSKIDVEDRILTRIERVRAL
jgi:hypothetical protein